MEKINLIKKESETHYKLSSEYTIYVQLHKYIVFDLNLNQLQETRKQLIKELRSKKIKVSTKENDTIFKEFSQDFYFKLGEYKTISEEVIQKFNTIYESGLYAPTSDNIQLKEAETLAFKLQELTYRSSALSVFNEIKNHIKSIKKDLEYGANFTRVSV